MIVVGGPSRILSVFAVGALLIGCSKDSTSQQRAGVATTQAAPTLVGSIASTTQPPRATTTTLPPTTEAPTTTSPPCPPTCTLRQAADLKHIYVGAAVDATSLQDPAYADAVVSHFNSVTAENAMKWTVLRPSVDVWDWTQSDAIVDFAVANDLAVRGHTMVWGQQFGNGLPPWMAEISDPAELERVMVETITQQITRYADEIDRWDVVNEPLIYGGADIDSNVYMQQFGIGYIARAFEAAHAADPDASLWINEAFTEYYPDRAAALLNLVTDLVEQGVPIHGVGLQTHLVIDSPTPVGSVDGLVLKLRDLGLDVAITELDVPMSPSRDAAAQAELYRQVASECLISGCSEITVWGVSDNVSWLDSPGIRASNSLLFSFNAESTPLLLDTAFEPKQAYEALVDVILGL